MSCTSARLLPDWPGVSGETGGARRDRASVRITSFAHQLWSGSAIPGGPSPVPGPSQGPGTGSYGQHLQAPRPARCDSG